MKKTLLKSVSMSLENDVKSLMKEVDYKNATETQIKTINELISKGYIYCTIDQSKQELEKCCELLVEAKSILLDIKYSL